MTHSTFIYVMDSPYDSFVMKKFSKKNSYTYPSSLTAPFHPTSPEHRHFPNVYSVPRSVLIFFSTPGSADVLYSVSVLKRGSRLSPYHLRLFHLYQLFPPGCPNCCHIFPRLCCFYRQPDRNCRSCCPCYFVFRTGFRLGE